MGYLLNNRKLKLVYQCIVLSLVLVFGQGASAITGNQDSCEGITYNLSTNSQDQGIAFPLLPSSGGNQVLFDTAYSTREYSFINGQYYIKYSGFGFTCIDKFSGIELPASLFPKKIFDIFWREVKFVKNCGMVSDFSKIIQIDENRFCGTKQENFKEYLMMFDGDGIKWKTHFENASSFSFLMLLGSNRILYGPNILDLETGKVLLELDKKYEPSMQEDVIKKGKIAVIEKSVVIDAEKPAVLWTLPENPKYHFNVMGFYEDKLIYFNTSSNLVSYYDPSSGELLKTFEFKPRLEPGERIGEIRGIAGKSIYSEFGYIVDLESGIVLSKKKIHFSFGFTKKWGVTACNEKFLFWEDDAGIECIDPEVGKILWRKEVSSYIYYQELEGRTYKNTIHLSDDSSAETVYTESLSIFEGGSWKELARVPFCNSHSGYYGSYITRDDASLIPTKQGILWLPYFQHESKGPSIIAPGTSKVLRTYVIPEWWGIFESSAGYALVDDTLLVNVDGQKLYVINLKSGKTEFIEIPDASKRKASIFEKPLPIFANKKYAITEDINRKIVSFDIEKKAFLRRLGEDGNKRLFSLGDKTTHLFVGEWFSAESYIQNLETGETIKIIEDGLSGNDKYILGATDKGFIIEKNNNLYLVVPGKESSLIMDFMELYHEFGGNYNNRFNWECLENYAISSGGVIDIDKKTVVQRYLSFFPGANKLFIFLDEMLLTNQGGTVKLSPCPSFSVKRTGRGGGDSKDGGGEVSFEFKNTREDGRDLVLKGEAYLVSWGDDGKAPVFAKLNEPKHKLGPLLPGMSQEITFKLPEAPLMEHNQKGEGKYFALVVESNGLMDREKSVLSEYDKDPRPLFDGTPVALDWQKAIVVTVWEK